MKFLSWNVQSLCNKADKVLQFLTDNGIEIACITETWLSNENSHITSIIKSFGYSITHFYTENCRGTGVAILFKNTLSVKPFSKFSSAFESFQYRCVVISVKNQPSILLFVIYRRQEFTKETFEQEFKHLLNFCDSTLYNIMLVGDFNYHFEKTSDNTVTRITNLISTYGLSPLIEVPTHRKGHTLDQIFVNTWELDVLVKEVVDVNISDHFPICFDLPLSSNTIPQKKNITYRKLRQIDMIDFEQKVIGNLEVALANSTELNFHQHYTVYSNVISKVLDEVAPLTTKVVKSSTNTPLWMDTQYKDERKLRRKLERTWKKTKLPDDRLAYINQRENCAELAKIKRAGYYSNLIAKCNGDQKALYSVVSDLLDTRKVKTLPICENEVELANKFNQFYMNKINNIRESIPYSSESNNEMFNGAGYKHFQGESFDHFELVTIDELKEIIKSSNTKTSCHDPLPQYMLNNILDSLLPYLCDLVNKSLSTGNMDGVKESIIVPLLKKAGLDTDDLKNYRPVSNLVFLSKLIERVVLKRLNAHMERNELHIKSQYGYKQFHSTETLMLRVVNDVLVGFDNNNATVVLLLDLSAAFDTVDSDKLLHILNKQIGITGTALKWFQSFLVGRNQRVKIGNSISDLLETLFGIAQGSVLGPTLFNIYTRTFSDIVKLSGFVPGGFADDNSARDTFALCFQYRVLTEKLQSLMANVTQWMNSLYLKINPDKTEIILFLPKAAMLDNVIGGTFLEGGGCIRFSGKVKNLGVTLDRHLTLEPHIKSIVSHCYKLLSDIGRIRSVLTNKQTESLVHSVISSRLDYCNSLFMGLNKSIIHKLQKVQNSAARLILKKRKRTSVRKDLKDLHWLRIDQRIMFKTLLLVYKCINDIAPDELKSLIEVNADRPHILVTPRLKTTHGRRSFQYNAPYLWNNLPEEIKTSVSLDNFKSKLKTFLFIHYDEFMADVNKYID